MAEEEMAFLSKFQELQVTLNHILSTVEIANGRLGEKCLFCVCSGG